MPSGAYNRKKGHDLEREAARDLRSLYPEARRGIQSRDGHEAPDVMGTPFWIETKAHRRVNIQKAMEQARTEAEKAGSKLPPMVVSKDNRKPALVTLEWDSFLVLLHRLDFASKVAEKALVDHAIKMAREPDGPPPPLILSPTDAAWVNEMQDKALKG